MTGTPTRFPLAWPIGRTRTKSPKSGNFKVKNHDKGYMVAITTAQAMERLEAEVARLGGVNVLLSTNVDTRLDGRPKSGQEPHDPGVCLYFTLDGKPMSMPCDAYTKVAQNIAALAAHIEATRAIARYGVATGAETLQAFQALPAPTVIQLGADRPWREVLGFPETFPETVREDMIVETIQRRWRAKQIEATDAERAALNVARDAALKELSLCQAS